MISILIKSKSLYELLTGDTIDRVMLGILFRRFRNVVSSVLKKDTIFLVDDNAICEIDERVQ